MNKEFVHRLKTKGLSKRRVRWLVMCVRERPHQRLSTNDIVDLETPQLMLILKLLWIV